MNAHLTKEQLDLLAPWEENFRTAVHGRWCLHPGTAAMDVILGVWNAATGEGRRLQPGCNRCSLNLLTDAGNLYFAEKERHIAAENDAKAVELTQADAAPVQKVEVKTTAKNKSSKSRKK